MRLLCERESAGAGVGDVERVGVAGAAWVVPVDASAVAAFAVVVAQSAEGLLLVGARRPWREDAHPAEGRSDLDQDERREEEDLDEHREVDQSACRETS